jgi:hypothetical protein
MGMQGRSATTLPRSFDSVPRTPSDGFRPREQRGTRSGGVRLTIVNCELILARALQLNAGWGCFDAV